MSAAYTSSMIDSNPSSIVQTPRPTQGAQSPIGRTVARREQFDLTARAAELRAVHQVGGRGGGVPVEATAADESEDHHQRLRAEVSTSNPSSVTIPLCSNWAPPIDG